jgi:hypothetical protein
MSGEVDRTVGVIGLGYVGGRYGPVVYDRVRVDIWPTDLEPDFQ